MLHDNAYNVKKLEVRYYPLFGLKEDVRRLQGEDQKFSKNTILAYDATKMANITPWKSSQGSLLKSLLQVLRKTPPLADNSFYYACKCSNQYSAAGVFHEAIA